LIYEDGRIFTATCFLIDEVTVITAAHCLVRDGRYLKHAVVHFDDDRVGRFGAAVAVSAKFVQLKCPANDVGLVSYILSIFIHYIS
jgi:V8-like Glu-specific endopeptidase